MNIEKSIKLMKVIKEILPEHFNFDFGKPEINEVIKRLQMWEDFKEKYKSWKMILYNPCGKVQHNLIYLMEEFEEEYLPKNNQNVIKLKRNTDQEVLNYYMKKFTEVYLENIHLKKKLGEKKENDKIFKVHMECVEMGGSGFIQKGDRIEAVSSEFTVNEMMNAQQCLYYQNAIWKSKIANYRGKKIRITEFTTTPNFLRR